MKKLVFLMLVTSFFIGWTGYAEETSPSEKETPPASQELEKTILDLISRLGDDDWQTRESAQEALIKIGMPARPFLEKTIAEINDPEVKMRAAKALKTIPDNIAKQNVINGLENLAQSKGYRFKGGVKMDVSGDAQAPIPAGLPQIKIEGYFTPDVVYFNVQLENDKALGGQFKTEVYQKDKKIVGKIRDGDEWQRIDEEFSSGMMLLGGMGSPHDFSVFKNCMKETSFAGEEKINDTECKTINVTLDEKEFLKSMENSMPLNGMLNITESSIKMWVGKKDNYIYKMMISVEMAINIGQAGGPDMKMKTSTELAFSDYGAEIKQDIPDDVSKLFEQDKPAASEEKNAPDEPAEEESPEEE